MKKIVLFSLLLASYFSFTSCNQDDPPGQSGGGTCSWQLTFDGQDYDWSGPYSGTDLNGKNAIFNSLNPGGSIALSSQRNGGLANVTMSILTPNAQTGSYSMNSSSTSTLNLFNLIISGSTYSSVMPGSNVTVIITQLDPNSLISSGNISGAGYVKGTFSGTVSDISGSLHTISGSFNAFRES